MTTKETGCSGTSYPLTVKFDSKLRVWPWHVTGNQTICEGTFIPLSVRSSARPDEVIFLKDGKPIAGNTAYSYNAYEPGTYTVQVRNGSCIATTEPLHLTVLSLKTPVLSNGTSGNCNGASLLSVQGPVEGVSYVWRRNSRTLYDAPGTTYLPKTEGLYAVVAVKGGCSAESMPRTITSVAPVITPTLLIGNSPVSKPITVCRQSVTLSYSAVANQSYQWRNNGQVIAETGNRLTLSRADQSGTYTLLTSVGSCTATQSATVQLYDDTYRPSLSTNGSPVLCSGQRLTLTTPKRPETAMSWERDGVTLTDRNQNFLVTTQPGSYILREMVSACESNQLFTSNPLVVSRIESASALLSGNQVLNYDSTAYLTVELTGQPPFSLTLSDGTAYSVVNGPTLRHPVRPKQTTSYTLREVRNGCGPGNVSGTAEVKVIILATEPAIDNGLSVYPVPATTRCDVTLDWPTATSATLHILNLHGRPILTEKSAYPTRSHRFQLLIGELPAGLYIVRVTVGGQVLSRKMLKL